MVTKENQIKFYTEELRELEFSVKKTFNSTGLSLFQNGDLYIGQYRGYDEKRGNIFVDIPFGKQYHSPRLDQKLNCFTLKEGMEKPSSWGHITYADLIKDRNRTETKIVDYIPSKRDGWITILLREMDSEFLMNLQYNQILAFGPTIPPFEYLENLKDFSHSYNELENTISSKILGFKYSLNNSRQPNLLIEDKDIANSIIEEVDKSNVYVFQGPPGTGKTHQIADVASRLVLNNKSVLIAALTNKAAIEVCQKPFINKLFDEGRISKLPLLTDERNKFPKLTNSKDLVPTKGHLTLTTFYQFSRIWQTQNQSYDYVIIEEASQAYLTTIAAACKVGKKVIIVGDPKQIVPIVTNKNYKIFPNIEELVNGMNTMSTIEEFAFSRKIETRRLTERSTEFTNSFYQNTMQCKSLYSDIKMDIDRLRTLSNYMHNNGGPSLVFFSNVFNNIDDQILNFLIKSIDELSLLKQNEIAVLTPYTVTLKFLQQNLKSKTQSKNYLIETVDRVQGLDVDYCFYVMPKSSSFSYNLNRFNVATSRAKKCTFILAEVNYDHEVNLQNDVANYLSKLKKEFSFNFDPVTNDITYNNEEIIVNSSKSVPTKENVYQIENPLNINKDESNQIGLKMVGFIDPSKFEKPKKEISLDKENIYIIDTNVFVDCPDVISKIDKQYTVVLSAKVIDELDYLKISLSDEQKKNVQKALRQINLDIDKRGIKMEVADLELLPNDFNKRSPDNMILSVALKFKSENPILLTSDNGLQIKCKGLGIKTISLKEFLKQRRY